MGYAVELYFDDETEKSIGALRKALFENGVSSTISDLGDRPHISLAVFANVDYDKLLLLTKAYAQEIDPFKVQLSAIGIFPTDENVLFLSPVLTHQLSSCHLHFHQRLVESQLMSSAYYLPENWIPHCTLEMNIPDKQFFKAIEICKKNFKPLFGQFNEIGVVEFRPVKPLGNWPLGK